MTMEEIMPGDNASLPLPPAVTVSRSLRRLDLCERGFVFAIFLHFAWVMLSDGARAVDFLSLLLVISEAIPFVLIMLRPASETLSRRPTDWLYGIAGVTLPLLIQPVAVAPLLPAPVCFVIMVIGTFVQLSAKIVLGRRFGVIAANRGVVTLGPYRFVRHPMYLGYSITHIGFLLSMPALLPALLYVTTFSVQVLRLLREEQVLLADDAYRAFAARVRYRLLPGIF